LTAEFDGHEVHLLGYFLDVQNPQIAGRNQKVSSRPPERIHEMVAGSTKWAFPCAPKRSLRWPIAVRPDARMWPRLVQEGFCASMDEAFERFSRKAGRPGCPNIKSPPSTPWIDSSGRRIGRAGPSGLNHCDQIIPHLAGKGLDGLECFHSKHTSTQCEYYLALAGA
jgi:3',5'-nucleoside bisphosphate phosphatase